jgi:hypothetical protein
MKVNNPAIIKKSLSHVLMKTALNNDDIHRALPTATLA